MDIDDILRDFENQARESTSAESQENQLRTEDFVALQKSWVAERASPELLAYNADVIERILRRVREKIEFIEYNSIELESIKDIKLKLMIVESEVERVSFLVRSYLRTRLAKIDKFTIYIHNSDEQLQKLNASEVKYMEKHFEILADLYNRQFLRNLPESLHALDDNSGGINMVVEPDLDTPVFFKVTADIDDVLVLGQEQVELAKDSIYVMRYSAVQHLLLHDQICLI